MGTILAVCTSREKGTVKRNVGNAELTAGYGINGDAHAGLPLRQVSLLAHEKIAAFRSRGADVIDGDFGENLVVEGIDLSSLPIGAVLCCAGVILEVTQIGKECHSHCEIFKRMGDCIMPREGIFARVIRGGGIGAGDEIHVREP
jgi:TatD DNase family protein